EAIDALARCCGYLPLALRIAAAQLLDQPGRPVADLVAELDRDRLSTLEVAGDEQNAVRVAFDLSYAALPADARRVFRLLGLVPGPDVTAEAVAALAGIGQRQAQRLLDRLAANHLAAQHATGRYTLHDLLRQYAADRALVEDDRDARDAAVRRLFDWYLASAARAADVLYGEMLRLDLPPSDQRPARLCTDGAGGAKAWLQVEQANLVGAIRHAASAGPHSVAWLLADALRGYFYHVRNTVHWLETVAAGLATAEAESDARAMAAMHLNLATANKCLEHWDLTTHHLALSRDLAQRAGWHDVTMHAAINLVTVYCDRGELRAALTEIDALLARAEQAGQPRMLLAALTNAGWIHREAGMPAIALPQIRRALVLDRELGLDGWSGTDLNNLGVVCHDLGRLDEAYQHLNGALTLHSRLGRRAGEAETRQHLALLMNDLGRSEEAVRQAEAAVRLTEDTGQRRVQAIALNVLGTICLGQRRPEQAVTHHRKALTLAASPTDRPRVDALVGLAAAYRALGRYDEAARHAGQVLEITRRAGFRTVEGRALAAQASIQLATGQHRAALDTAEQALAIFRETGYRLGEARILTLLGEIDRDAGRTEEGAQRWRTADKIFIECGSPERAPRSSIGH
ncbi:MAG: tetratricopeptide repeat protein, partial [Micromonosporaceae bacterium]|nr:tetratricopeptide repeat protein [Micromonosporaceae bacterium]